MKLNRSHSRNQSQFQARLQAQKNAYRGETEEVSDLSVQSSGSGIFKSDDAPPLENIDDLVVAGNKTFKNLDNVNFAKFRNDKALGKKVLQETREEVAKFHQDTSSEAYKSDVRRVLHARYLQGHGIQVEKHLDGQELKTLRKYIQKETSTNNVADSARAINRSLKAGEEDVKDLLLDAESYLFEERGISEQMFEAKFADKKLKDLGQIRDFSDAWSASQSGKYLTLAHGKDFNEMRDSMTREMLAARGYDHVNAVDLDTAMSLLRDIDSEGPRTNATIAKTVNQAIASGEQNYFVLSTLSNQAILGELGLSQEAIQKMDVSDKKLAKKYPKLSGGAAEGRAIRTRVLRDLLRVLPDGERELAIEELANKEADLISAEKVLSKHLGRRIRDYSGHSAPYGKMGAMQRANLASALSKLPPSVRSFAFDGPNDTTLDRMEKAIESRFGIEVHREAGKAANGNKSYEPFVKDWPVQGLADLYNAMESMSRDGKLPSGLAGHSVISYMEGAPKYPGMAVGPQAPTTDPVGPWNRPGAYAHASGKSGYFGEAAPDKTGNDILFIYDDAMKGSNGDSAVGLSIGEGTMIHEFGHAIQLGGIPGTDKKLRQAQDRLNTAEWSSLSRWMEPDNVLADGAMGTFEYYYDPTVQVGKREEVATSYGASDPSEDFAEYTPFFYKDPETAMNLSAEKFLYFNNLVEGFYTPEQVLEVGAKVGLSESDLAAAQVRLEKKIVAAPKQAQLAKSLNVETSTAEAS